MITRHGNSTYPTWSSFILLFKRSLSPLILVLIAGLCGQLLLSAPMLAQQPRVTVGTATGAAGTSVDLPVSFTAGATGVASMNFDLTLPTGLSYVSCTTGAAATAAGKSTSGNAVGNIIHVLIAGMNNNAIGSGSMGTISLSIAPGTPPGTLTVGISGIVASDVNAISVTSLGTNGSVTVSLPADTTPPIISAVGSSSVTASGATISWTTNEASDSQVDYGTTAGYGTSTTLNTSLVTSHSAALSGLASSTLYHYRVKSKDAANNLATSGDFTFTTSAPPDTTAPTVPTNLTATAASSTQINLAWTASTDTVGVTGYKIFRNGTQIATSTVTSYQSTGLTPSTTYSYTVSAYDAANNNSAPSTAASATTQAPPDTTAPSVPTNLTATAASSTQINLAWTASTDNVAVTGYKIFRNGTQIGTSTVTSYQNTGLTGSTTYNYTVSAYDAANNNSAQSSTASATTQAASDTTSP
ncbi:MAG: fibronectin type III domain-containing protein, partial [Terriglobia bacterium]